MKKSIFFLIIVLIVIVLSFTIVINSVNGKNKSDLNLAKEQPMKIENDQVNVIEEPENKVIEDNTEVEDVQTNTEITEVIDQPQIQEMQEEKVISSTPKIEKKTQVVQTTKVESKPQEIGTGNSGKWFNSESDAIKYYKSIIKTWGDKWEKFEIDDETYNKNCPYGYEDWSCPYCGRWTINFYYN